MKKKINLLIIGSNFGINHLKAAEYSKNFNQIAICSPNINKKKIKRKFIVFDSYKTALNKFQCDLVSIATLPNIQDKIVKYIYKHRKDIKYLFLEKPLLKKTILFLKNFLDKKIFFDVNFIFFFDNKWILYKKIISKNYNKIINFNYKWLFKQKFFVNFKKTWKIRKSDGGGLIFNYLPHAIFNIYSIFPNIKFVGIKNKKYIKNLIIYLELNFMLKQKICTLVISNNSEKNIHQLDSFLCDKKKYTLINSTKNWIRDFKIKHNNKEIFARSFFNKNLDDRVNVLSFFYKNINKYFSKDNIYKRNKLIYKTFQTIQIISDKA
jgi:hypothetical protein